MQATPSSSVDNAPSLNPTSAEATPVDLAQAQENYPREVANITSLVSSMRTVVSSMEFMLPEIDNLIDENDRLTRNYVELKASAQRNPSRESVQKLRDFENKVKVDDLSVTLYNDVKKAMEMSFHPDKVAAAAASAGIQLTPVSGVPTTEQMRARHSINKIVGQAQIQQLRAMIDEYERSIAGLMQATGEAVTVAGYMQLIDYYKRASNVFRSETNPSVPILTSPLVSRAAMNP